MFNENEFKGKVKSNGMTLEEVARHIGISPSTLTRKMQSKTDFFRGEVEIIRQLLKLTDDDIIAIFFAE